MREYFDETEDGGAVCRQDGTNVLIAKIYLKNDILTNEQYSKIRIIYLDGKEITDFTDYFTTETIKENSYYKVLEEISV